VVEVAVTPEELEDAAEAAYLLGGERAAIDVLVVWDSNIQRWTLPIARGMILQRIQDKHSPYWKRRDRFECAHGRPACYECLEAGTVTRAS
jgi:hypothetical protein